MNTKREGCNTMKKHLLFVCALLCMSFLLFACDRDESNNDVDIDLSELSLTLVQAEHQRIVSNPNDYIGKTIKVYGSFRTFIVDNAGNLAHFIIIVPGDDCCQIGFEFRRNGEYKFPDDYPAQNSMLLISGTLDKSTTFGTSSLFIDVIDFTALRN